MKRLHFQALIVFVFLNSCGLAGALPNENDRDKSEARPFAYPNRIRYDSQCFTIDGKDVFIFSGSFHYFRCPKELWAERFQTIKDAGFNAVETYTAWNWHEREKPVSPADFSKITGMRDLDDWLTMAEKFGFYIIVRPGPYICAEWDNGGFPRWMSTLEKPAGARMESWLRSDDAVYLAWCKHWYDAVCPVIAKHQLTRKAPGEPGVILFQIENEYNYWKVSSATKVNDLFALVKDAQADGIDVPLFTCATQQPRGVKSGPLRAVFDCTNFYPGMRIEHTMRPAIQKQRGEQPDAPLATSELQAGWFTQVGGKVSDLSPQQIQNLTLFAWQMGDTLTNYYMLFGGTNFDDWGGGAIITSYDYDAPIREDGGVNLRYQRVLALGDMIREHGAKLARAKEVKVTASATDKDVEIAERRAQDGSRYFFVRTENANTPRVGTARVKEKDEVEVSFHYELEKFGSIVLYLPPGVVDAKQGEWLPKRAPGLQQPGRLPLPVVIRQVERSAESELLKWEPLQPGAPLESLGVYGSHFLFYKIAAQPNATVTLQVQKRDGIIASANGKLLPGTSGTDDTQISFTLPPDAKELVALYENLGHPQFGPTLGQLFGILSAAGADKPLQVARGTASATESEYGEEISRPTKSMLAIADWKPVSIGKGAPLAPDALLTWYLMQFDLPEKGSAPWLLHIEANGNGFVYVNGHCLGRYWQAGPQHDFFLPDCWLHFGPGTGGNKVALDLRPVDKGVSLQAVAVAPDSSYAVEIPTVSLRSLSALLPRIHGN